MLEQDYLGELEKENTSPEYATKEELDKIVDEIMIEYKNSLEKLKYV